MWLASLVLVVSVNAAAPAGAEAVLERSRQALGGASRLQAIQSLSLTAELRRVLPASDGGESRDMSGDLELDLLLPDRYRKTERLSPLPGMPPFGLTWALDGEEAWTATDNANMGHGGGAVVVRMGPGGAAPDGPAAREGLRRRLRTEMARLLLAALATGTPSFPLQFTSAGEAESPDGKASVLEVSGPEGFAARLFVDARTGRPLMLTYRDRPARMTLRTSQMTRGADRDQAVQQAKETAERTTAAPAERPSVPEAEFALHLDDYHAVDGVLLPHRLSLSVDGKPTEEWQVKSYRINPSFKADRFREKK
jgi:hypothetical protein